MKSLVMRNWKPTGNAIAFAFAAFTAVAANATTYYWQGDENADPLVPSNYSTDTAGSSRLTELPEAGSTVDCTADSHDITFGDDSVAFLASLDMVCLQKSTRCVIDISTNAAVSAKFNYNHSGTGVVVKRGAGTLEFNGDVSEPYTSGSAKYCDAYYTRFVVENGDLVFPQSGQASGVRQRHAGLQVAKGSTVILDGGLSTVAFDLYLNNGSVPAASGGLSGGGNVAYTNDTVICSLYAGGTDELFSGILSGDNLRLYVTGDLMLNNSANTFAYGGTSTAMFFYGGTLGFRKFGVRNDTSSFGQYGAAYIQRDKSSPITFLCLADSTDGVQTGDLNIREYNGQGTVTFDGGAYGGFTYSGSLQAYHDRMNELVLTGFNTEECVWSGGISQNSGKTGRWYLAKRGTGTWRIPKVTNNTKMIALAGIGVENGTLAFEQVAEAGTMCSLGSAPADYLFGYALKDTIENAANRSKVTYAIRLGNVSDMSEEGAFEYVGTSAGICTTRPIAITGRGRIKNSAVKNTTNYELRWEGIRSVVPPEDATLVPALSTLTFDGSKGAGWATNITEDTGAAPLRIAKEGTGTWTLGGTLGFTGGIDVREGTLNIGAAVSAVQPYLRCDGGAVLDASGGSVTAAGLAIDATKGVGTISGVAFASAGTVAITNFTDDVMTFPCGLSACTGLGNISNWKVFADGTEVNVRVVATATGIRITRAGLVIVIK